MEIAPGGGEDETEPYTAARDPSVFLGANEKVHDMNSNDGTSHAVVGVGPPVAGGRGRAAPRTRSPAR